MLKSPIVMLTANTLCLIEACQKKGIQYSVVDETSDFVAVYLDKPYYFLHSTAPFNTLDVARICRDKAYTYTLLHDVIAMPDTKPFLDPEYKEFKDSSQYESVEEITDEIMREFGVPVIVKMNAGSRKRNVYTCRSREDITTALTRIYDQNTKNYDYIALAQKLISIKQELRVVVLNKKISLVYEKYTFKPVADALLITKLQDFIAPVYDVFNLEYGGFDIAIDSDGNLKVIEINSAPRFAPYVKYNGSREIIRLYEDMLEALSQRK